MTQPAAGPSASNLPQNLRGVSFEQRLGSPLPLDAPFVDENGKAVTLGDYTGDKPMLVALVYYDCPMLCGLVLNGLSTALKPLGLDPGADFEVVVVSFDHRETPEMAREAKARTLERYGKEGNAEGLHFLTGTETSIASLAEAVGFEYEFLPESGEFAHAAGLVVTTPDGRASRYLYGVEYPPRDLRLALVEASSGEIGTPVDQLLLYCFQYDPTTGKYSAVVMNIVRAGGTLTLLLLVGFILLMLRRDRAQALRSRLGTA